MPVEARDRDVVWFVAVNSIDELRRFCEEVLEQA